MRLCVCLAMLLGLGGVARAQTLEPPRPRQGYYVAAGLGGAALVVWEEEGGRAGPLGGFAFALRAGQLLTPTLGLGIQLDFGGASGGGDRAQLVGLGLQGQWEVAPNLALRAGVGLGVAGLDDPDEEGEKLRGAVGAGYTLGVSYDWFWTARRTGGWALTPAAQVRVIPGDSTALVGLFTLEVTYWTGLPPNQLELPEGEAYQKPR